MIIEFLKGFIEVLNGYFKEVEEESIKDNFVIIYELLDECIDNGFIQCLDTNLLKEYIKTSYHELIKPSKNKPAIMEGPQVGKSISWRKEGIKHKENECFLDVIEKLNFTISVNGVVTRSEIVGSIKANSKLSGMPIIELGLNEKHEAQSSIGQADVDFDDVKFHKCVNLQEYENRKNIVFTPPDGEFELMTYLIKTLVKPLFSVLVDNVSISDTKIEKNIKVTSNFKSLSSAHDVSILIPVPCDTNNWSFTTKFGEVSYAPEKDCLVWKIANFKGEETYGLDYKLLMPTLSSRNFKSQQRQLSE